MSSRCATILSRHKDNMMFLSKAEDFTLGEFANIDPESILKNPCWSLYCLDPDLREAVFVKTPQEIDLTTAPFLFQSQFLHAQQVSMLDFERFHQLSYRIKPDPNRILFIHSVGRCGSTLMSQVFSKIPAVCSLAEHDPLTQITLWRGSRRLQEDELSELCESSTRFACKPWPSRQKDRFWVFKYRAQCIAVADWLMQAFPEAKQMFIHRRPLDWMRSVFRVFVDKNQIRDPNFMALFERVWAEYFKLIRDESLPEKPMSVAKTWILIWIAIRETHAQCLQAGYQFHELNYEDLCSKPEDCLKQVFEYCGLCVADWGPVHQCLSQDSQAGTTIARDRAEKSKDALPEDGRVEAIQLLQKWGYPVEVGKTEFLP